MKEEKNSPTDKENKFEMRGKWVLKKHYLKRIPLDLNIGYNTDG